MAYQRGTTWIATPKRTMPSDTSVRVFFFGLLAAALSAAPAAAQWRQFGGPERNFTVKAAGLADKWPDAGPRKQWERPLGPGYAGIVVGKGQVYTMFRYGDDEAIRAMYADDGRTNFEFQYPAPLHPQTVLDFGKGPNSTPLLLDDRIITAGFTGIVYCLSLKDGKPFWNHDLVKAFKGKIQEFGYSSSPLLYRDKVIVLVGGEETGAVALDTADGAVKWKSPPLDISYASPILIDVDGQNQIVFMSSTEVIGLNADTGALLWRHPHANEFKNNCTTPVWGSGNRLWVSSHQDGGGRMLQLAHRDGTTEVKELWYSRRARVFHWNTLWLGDYLYACIGDEITFLAAIEAATGEIAWRERGFNKANLLHADGKVIALDEDGKLSLLKLSPQQLSLLSRVDLLEKTAWTAPTLAGRTLYVRDQKRILALDLGSP